MLVLVYPGQLLQLEYYFSTSTSPYLMGGSLGDKNPKGAYKTERRSTHF